MMICEIKFVHYAVNFGKVVNELSFWVFDHAVYPYTSQLSYHLANQRLTIKSNGLPTFHQSINSCMKLMGYMEMSRRKTTFISTKDKNLVP